MSISTEAPRAVLSLALVIGVLACTQEPAASGVVVTFPSSTVGAEAEVLQRQIARFMRLHPGTRVVRSRTPDAADERHLQYVQWLNAHARDPDVLQLDVIWTPEFAAAGWLAPLDRFEPERGDFFASALAANRYHGKLYALPWFIDVGMLYYRSDALAAPPTSYAQLVAQAKTARARGFEQGLVFQAARYEGLVTVFIEYLQAFGGQVLDADGKLVLGTPAARAALAAMCDAIGSQAIVPRAALAYQEEQVRFAFQNGRALFMRNWPYAYPLLQGKDSAVVGKFAVTAFPPAPGGRPAAALGGSQLAINAHSDQPEAAYALIEYLTQPAQMLERARMAGQFPARRALYQDPALARALPIAPSEVLRIIDSAVARPATPVYAELSDILQIHVHRCLSGQEGSAEALQRASREIDALLQRTGLAPRAARSGKGAPGG